VAMIEKDTQNLSFTYDSSIIHINLGREYKHNETYKIFIDYVAKPNDNKQKGSAAISDAQGIYFINPLKKDADKPRQIWTQGETQSNSGWFPTNDVPNEKMTQEIYITVDEKEVTLSNGEHIPIIGNKPCLTPHI
jgi:aminopeptidase N